MFYLNVLVNVIISYYFNQSQCIIHYYDNPDELVNSDHVPKVIRRINGTDNLKLDRYQKCRLFLLQCQDAKQAFESTEYVIKIDSIASYNDRKYIILVDGEDAFNDLFNSTVLSFVKDLLVIYTPNIRTDAVTGLMKSYSSLHINQDTNQKDLNYYLYTHKYVGSHGNNDPILLDIWFGLNSSFMTGINVFPDKLTDQQGREFRAPCFTLIPYAYCEADGPPFGSEHNIILKYSQRFNMTLNLYLNGTYDHYGNIYFNWTGEGTMEGLIVEDENYCDVVYGGFPSTYNCDLVATVRYSYEASVPIPLVKYGYFMFLDVFDVYIWTCVFLLFLSIRFLVYLRHVKVETMLTEEKRSYTDTIILYGLLINQSATISQDIKNSLLLKYTIILMLLSCTWIVTAYSSRLSSVMTKPELEGNINTLQELSKSKLKLLFFDAYYKVLSEDTRKVYQALYNKRVLIANSTDFHLSEEMLASRKYAVAMYRRNTGGYFEQLQHLMQIDGRYKSITPELFTDFYYILLRKNSMHTVEMQKLVRTAIETGLMNFWEEDALRLHMESTFQKQLQEYKIKNTNDPLNLQHLKGIFAFWGFNMVISIIIFLKEYFWLKEEIVSYEYHN